MYVCVSVCVYVCCVKKRIIVANMRSMSYIRSEVVSALTVSPVLDTFPWCGLDNVVDTHYHLGGFTS